MSTTGKENTFEIGFGSAISDEQVKSHGSDPAVRRQIEKARETLKKVGLPKEKMNSQK